MFFWLVWWRCRIYGIGGFSAGIQVVEQTEGIVPFQRDAFVGEPEVRG